MDIRPFRTDLPIRFRFLSMFNPENRSVSCYLLWFNSMNHGELSRHKVNLTPVEVEDEETGEMMECWDTVFSGVDQRKLGVYSIILILNENQDGQQQYVLSDVFQLVLNYEYSYDVDSLRVIITIGKRVAPFVLIGPDGDIHSESRTIVAHSNTEGVQFKYTLDGSDPRTIASAQISDGVIVVTLAGWITLRVIAFKEGWASSAEQSLQFEVRKIYTPTIEASGTAETERVLTMNCQTEGAEIYYTLDGSTPTKESLRYNSDNKPVLPEKGVLLHNVNGKVAVTVVNDKVPLRVRKPKTDYVVKAIAVKDEWTDSEVNTQEIEAEKYAVSG